MPARQDKAKKGNRHTSQHHGCVRDGSQQGAARGARRPAHDPVAGLRGRHGQCRDRPCQSEQRAHHQASDTVKQNTITDHIPYTAQQSIRAHESMCSTNCDRDDTNTSIKDHGTQARREQGKNSSGNREDIEERGSMQEGGQHKARDSTKPHVGGAGAGSAASDSTPHTTSRAAQAKVSSMANECKVCG